MYKIYKNKDEMIELFEDERSSIKKSNSITTAYINLDSKNRFIKYFLIFIILIVIIKILFGEINLYSPLKTFNSKYHQVKVNAQIVNIGVEEKNKIVLIPFLVNIHSFSFDYFYHKDISSNELVFELNEKILLNVESFNCAFNVNNINYKVSCNGENFNLATKSLFSDISYKIMIKRTNKGETIKYDGQFKEDISDYFDEKGGYLVRVIASYNNVDSNIYFWVRII